MLKAQSDTAYSSSYKTSEENLLMGVDSLRYIDTSMDDFHLYYPAFKKNYGLLDLGNSGTAIYPLVFQLNNTPGFDLGWHYMDFNRTLYSESNNLYKTRKPITSLYYKQGPNNLLGMEALHSQNIKPNWNFGVEFRRLKEDGFYINQRSSSYNTRLFNWYHTKDFRYHVIGSAIWNRIDNQESGGIYNRASFDTLSGAIRNPLIHYYQDPVRNKLRSNHFTVTQLYRFGQKRHFPTEALDSLNRPIPDSIATFIPQHQISLRASLQTYSNLFTVGSFKEDNFTNFYLDSTQTFDSTFYRNGELSLGYETGAFKRMADDSISIQEKKYYFSAFFDINFIKVAWLKDYAAYTNIALRSVIATRSWMKEKTGLYAKIYSCLHGYNAGDFDLHLQSAQYLSFFRFEGSLRLKGYQPNFFSYYYFGNHNFWYNKNLKQQKANQLELSISNKGSNEWFRLSYTANNLNDYIYLGPDAMPHQYSSSINLQQAKLQFKAAVRWLHWHGNVVWQKASVPSVLPVPQFASKQTLFAEGWLFKHNLSGRLGVDLFWCSQYNAPEYVASLRSFKVQDPNGAFQVGNYPFINVYVTGRIKTVTFFVMLQHATAGIFGNSYYSSPYYPMQPRAVRLGIQWKLYE
ncbi:MAG: hypothetical protein GC180_04880 [Bacteroidetes bacterium]|nr:hypothetical protein [Bacteroidota bacterium]